MRPPDDFPFRRLYYASKECEIYCPWGQRARLSLRPAGKPHQIALGSEWLDNMPNDVMTPITAKRNADTDFTPDIRVSEGTIKNITRFQGANVRSSDGRFYKLPMRVFNH